MASACITSSDVAQLPMLVGLLALILASTAASSEIPELGILLALPIFVLVSQAYCKSKCCEGAYKRLVSSLSMLPPSRLLTVIVAGIFLTAAVVSGMPQVGFALSSAIAYVVLHSIGESHKKQQATRLTCKVAAPVIAAAPARTAAPDRHASPLTAAPWRQGSKSAKAADLQARPEATGIDAEVQAIVRAGLSTAADELVVRQLVNHVRKSVLPLVPEAKIVGCAAGNIANAGAQGLKPEVDIMVIADPDVLAQRLKEFYRKAPTNERGSPKSMATLLPDVLQKTATRVLSERLTSLRFWRSQFCGPEPKIVLLVPAALGFCQYPIRLNFSVNNPYPQRLSTVLSKGHSRCKELILLVIHWANVRGIANTGKGHLHPYAYSLLVIHFLRGKSEGELAEKSAIDLFGDFAHYYGDWFSRADAVVVRFGVGDQPLSPESTLFGIPFIEDPYAAGRDVAATMTADGVARLREELARSIRIVDAGVTTLGELLERWIPAKGGEDS